MNLSDEWCLEARDCIRRGALGRATELYERVLKAGPDREAAGFLGAQALRAGNWPDAIAHLGMAATMEPLHADSLRNFGFALFGAGRMQDAAASLESFIRLAPEAHIARLHLGLAQWECGDAQSAVYHCTRAIAEAQQRGRWLDPGTTPAELVPMVQRAVRVTREQRQQFLSGCIARQARTQCAATLERLEAFIQSCAGWPVQRIDPRQRPKTHYFPGLTATPWIDPASIPWACTLEDNFPTILREYTQVANQPGGFEPFLKLQDPGQASKYLGGSGPEPRWDAFFFYRHGTRNEENCLRCPRTAELLDSLPLLRLSGLAPEICFSVLTPGTRILPHRGDSNLRCVVHLPLVVPQNCELKVQGEPRSWHPGKVLAFDDTYEHEAWNYSEESRAVLILDAWNPHLSEAERLGVATIVDGLHTLHEEQVQLDRIWRKR